MIRVEASRQLLRVRTWVGFAGLAALPTIVAIANRVDAGGEEESGQWFYEFATASGVNHALASLAFMSPFFLVIVVSMFGGECVAGEANWGTLRSLLTRPVSRARLLSSKLLIALVLSLGATMAVVGAGLIAGTLAFGWHDTRILTFSIPATEALSRLLLSGLYVWWTMTAIVAVAFFLSTLTDS